MQKQKRPVFLLFAVLIVIVATALTTMRGQTKDNSNSAKQDNQKKLAEDFYTIADYDAPEPSDPEKRAKRRARGKRHNSRFQNAKDAERFKITERTESSWGTPPFDVPLDPALPITKSDAVIIGEVTDAQAYLSEDKTSVYSEFTVSVGDVLKNVSSALLTADSSIAVERGGGAVRFLSGKVIKFGMRGRAFPRIGKRYLFFLKYNNEGQDFSIITAYELSAGRVCPLDGIDKDSRALDRYPDYQKYKDRDEVSFLNEVRAAIANDSEGRR